MTDQQKREHWRCIDVRSEYEGSAVCLHFHNEETGETCQITAPAYRWLDGYWLAFQVEEWGSDEQPRKTDPR